MIKHLTIIISIMVICPIYSVLADSTTTPITELENALPDGTEVWIDSDGNVIYTLPDGTQIVETPPPTTTLTDVTTLLPTAGTPQPTTTTADATTLLDGTTRMIDSDGNVIIILPDGTQIVETHLPTTTPTSVETAPPITPDPEIGVLKEQMEEQAKALEEQRDELEKQKRELEEQKSTLEIIKDMLDKILKIFRF